MSQRLSDETLARIRSVVIDGATFYEPNQPMDRQHVQLWRDEVAALLADLEEARAEIEKLRAMRPGRLMWERANVDKCPDCAGVPVWSCCIARPVEAATEKTSG